MNRLTFRENDKFGVVGMNEENQDKKLYACVLKLTDYEDTMFSPNDILKLKEENDGYDKTMKYLNRVRDENKQLKQQLKEKYKEIAHLKDGLAMRKNIKRYDIGEMLVVNAKLKQSQKQLAIQELEKVKVELKERIEIMIGENHCYPLKVVDWHTICDKINKHIENLKSNKKD